MRFNKPILLSFYGAAGMSGIAFARKPGRAGQLSNQDLKILENDLGPNMNLANLNKFGEMYSSFETATPHGTGFPYTSAGGTHSGSAASGTEASGTQDSFSSPTGTPSASGSASGSAWGSATGESGSGTGSGSGSVSGSAPVTATGPATSSNPSSASVSGSLSLASGTDWESGSGTQTYPATPSNPGSGSFPTGTDDFAASSTGAMGAETSEMAALYKQWLRKNNQEIRRPSETESGNWPTETEDGAASSTGTMGAETSEMADLYKQWLHQNKQEVRRQEEFERLDNNQYGSPPVRRLKKREAGPEALADPDPVAQYYNNAPTTTHLIPTAIPTSTVYVPPSWANHHQGMFNGVSANPAYRAPDCPNNDPTALTTPSGENTFWLYLGNNWVGNDINLDYIAGKYIDSAGSVQGCAINCEYYNNNRNATNPAQPLCVGVSWQTTTGFCFMKYRMPATYYIPPAAGLGWANETWITCHPSPNKSGGFAWNMPFYDGEWYSMVNVNYQQGMMDMTGTTYPFTPSGPNTQIIYQCPNYNPNPYNATVYIGKRQGALIKATSSFLVYPGHDWLGGTTIQASYPQISAPVIIPTKDVYECMNQCVFINANSNWGQYQPLCQEVTFAGNQPVANTNPQRYNCYIRSSVPPRATWPWAGKQMTFDCQFSINPWNATNLTSALLASDHLDIEFPWGAMTWQ